MVRVRRKPKQIAEAVKGYKSKGKNLVKLFLDSGAFGAWSRGEELDIKKYIRYCNENAKHIWAAVCLDKIPGKFGRRDNSQAEAEVAAKQSYKNQQIMKDGGVNAVPVFHQGDPVTYLEQYLKDGETYIGISCNKFVRIDEQQRWLDSVFNILTDSKGIPYVKTHGFALTAFPHLTSYPWFTVDSTTWSLTPGYGQIIIPSWIDGEWDYLHPPTRIAISGVTHKSVSSQKKQFENLGGHSVGPSAHQEIVRRYLEDVVGCTIDEVRYGTNNRRKAMLIYYIGLCKALRDVRFKGARARISGKHHYDTSHMKSLPAFNLTLTFATSLNREWSELMTAVGANARLLSYWEMKDRPNEILAEYVETGTHGLYRRQKLRATWDETYLNKRRLALLARIKEYNDMAPEAKQPPIEIDEGTAVEAEEAASGLRK